jgi:chromate transporter
VRRAGHAGEVLLAFLRLGVSSFGGPIAHLGYFHDEFVVRRRWLREDDYAQLLALCQFLPGPASSQVGFAIGLRRAGWAGGLAAWLGFTLPSALLMVGAAMLVPSAATGLAAAALQGLKIVALVVVAHGVLGMARRLCRGIVRAAIAALTAVVLLVTEPAWWQLVTIGGGLAAGALLLRDAPAPPMAGTTGGGRRAGAILLAVFALLLTAALIAPGEGPIAAAGAFVRAGALVFGGGHVVLPLLEEAVVAPGWVTQDAFLAGYGAAQSVPGPMFTLAAYLGTLLPGTAGGLAGAAVALVAIFLPGMLLLAGVLPFWHALARRPRAAAAMAGASAAVVGLLGAALVDPVAPAALGGAADLAIAAVGFALLQIGRAPALLIVLWCVAARVATTALGA